MITAKDLQDRNFTFVQIFALGCHEMVIRGGKKSEVKPIVEAYARNRFGGALGKICLYPRTYIRDAARLAGTEKEIPTA